MEDERDVLLLLLLRVSETQQRQNKLKKEDDSDGGVQKVTPSTLGRVFLQGQRGVDRLSSRKSLQKNQKVG